MTDPVASEPAEPTTRQGPRTRDAVLARVIEEANEQVDDDWTTAGTLAFREYFGERLATRLADLGLLADPAQTTELEELRAENGQLQAQLTRLLIAMGASTFEQAYRWTSEIGGTLGRVENQRDCLSLLLRGMARKLVAYRRWACGDVPMVYVLQAEIEEHKLLAARDEASVNERQARIDRALKWWRQERDADHGWPLSLEDSAKVNSLRYRVYAALTGHPLAEQPLPAETDDNSVRAALVGDQPSVFDLHRAGLPTSAEARKDAAALSGEALRDVEERDDAAGDLP